MIRPIVNLDGGVMEVMKIQATIQGGMLPIPAMARMEKYIELA